MKILKHENHFTALIVCGLLMTAPAMWAQGASSESTSESKAETLKPKQSQSQSQPQSQSPSQSRSMLQASKVIGMTVKSDNGEMLGEIEDMAVDVQARKISYVALSMGGVLGVGDRLVAVPYEALSFDSKGKHFVLAASKEELQQAESLKEGEWPEKPAVAWGARKEAKQTNRERLTRGQSSEPAREPSADRSSLDDPVQEAPASPQAESPQFKNGAITVRLNEEKLQIEKKEVPAGGVLIRKTVETEQVNRPVELKRERIEIERLQPGEAPPEGATEFKEREIYIPLTREEAVVNKEAEVREVLRVKKTIETEQEEIEAQLRKESVDIERRGDARGQEDESPEAAAKSSQSESVDTAKKDSASEAGGSNEAMKKQIQQALSGKSGQSSLLGQSEMEKLKIEIGQEGEVTLKGTVQDQEQKKRIVARVKQVEGVKQVKDELTIRGK